MREDALLHAGHEHRRELQALGGVDGHHGDGMRLAGQGIQVGAQGQPLHKCGKRLTGERTVGALNLIGMHGTRRQLRRRGICVARDGGGQGVLRRECRSGQAIERIGARGVTCADQRLKRRRGRGRSRLGRRCAHHNGLGLSAGRHIGNASRAQLFQALERTLDILVRLLKFGCDTQEFLNVLGAALGLHGALGAKSLQQARLIDNHLDDVLELAVHATALAHQRHKARQAVAHLGAKHARLGCRNLAGLEERTTVVARQLLDLLNRGGTDAAARRVDDALDAHLVGRVHDHLEIGHDVTDLGTVEESRAADDLVGHARAQEHIFENTRLSVGAVEHGNIVVARALGMQLLDLAGNPATLVTLIARLEGLNLLAIALGRKQALVLALRVVAHHGVGGAQDMARGTVVLLQFDRLAVFKVLLKVQNVGDVGAAPTVNGLVVVAHDHEVLVLGGQQVGNLVLNVVGVLILVDANVAEALLVLVEHLGAGAQQLERAHEQVVEVHGVGGAQAALQL